MSEKAPLTPTPVSSQRQQNKTVNQTLLNLTHLGSGYLRVQFWVGGCG